MAKKILFLILSFSLHAADLLVTEFENKNVERVLDNINTLFADGALTPGLSAIVTPLATQSPAVINSALDQLHPAQYSALIETKTEIGAQILSYFHRKPYIACNYERLNRVWAEPYLDWLEERRHGKQIGFHSNIGGVAVGYDRAFWDNGVIGVGAVYNHSAIDWHPKRGKADINSFYGAIYLDEGTENFYIAVSLMGGIDFNHVKRNIVFLATEETAKASFKSYELMAQLSTAYFFGTPVALFYPFANVDFFYTKTSAFSESGADGIDLNVQANVNTAVRIEEGLALQIQDTNYAETACISPFVALSWVSIVPFRPQYTAEFAGETLTFNASGWNHTWQMFAGQFGLRTDYLGYSFNFGYRFELSTGDNRAFFNQRGDIRFEIKW